MKGKYRPPTREQQQTFEAWYKAYMEKKERESYLQSTEGNDSKEKEGGYAS